MWTRVATVLVVVRHAEAVKREVGGPPDDQRPLTDEGRRQAVELVDQIARWEPTEVLSSPLLRAVETVAPTAAHLDIPVHRRQDLREWDDGLTTLRDGEWEPLYERCWMDPSYRYGDGESHQQLIDRAEGALVELLGRTDHGCCVVASHGAWISRGLEDLGVSDPYELWLQMPTPAIYRIDRLDRLDQGIKIEGPGLVATLPPIESWPWGERSMPTVPRARDAQLGRLEDGVDGCRDVGFAGERPLE
jgi:2,3-bisphosphoglycerate-dependent phosphoglycerate mutase